MYEIVQNSNFQYTSMQQEQLLNYFAGTIQIIIVKIDKIFEQFEDEDSLKNKVYNIM